MQADVQQEPKQKKRIGRARFLLEFIVAGALLKASSVASAVIPMFVFASLGMFLAIWASIKRLRDIKRSEWWATVLIVPLALGIIAGAVIASSGVNDTATAYMKPIGIGYMIIYFLYVAVLLFWPSAYPKDTGVGAAIAEKGVATQTPHSDRETNKSASVSDLDDNLFAQAAREIDTNQRDAGVWARAYSDAEGDENRAKALYIRYRAQRINASQGVH